LIDDAANYVDLILRKYYEDKNVILRTADGYSIEQPDEASVHAAIAWLFDHPDSDNQVWLSDHQDRWLGINSDGQIIFYDQGPEQKSSLERIDLNQVMQLFKDMKAGNVQAIRNAFAFANQTKPSLTP
jgi:hypothetical protein